MPISKRKVDIHFFSYNTSQTKVVVMSGHTAFNAVTIIKNLPLKVECLDTWGEKLIVGTTDGILLIYQVMSKKDGDTTSPFFVKLEDSKTAFAKKPIRQISVHEEQGIMITLTDMVHVHDLGSFTLRHSIAKTKGALLFSADRSGGMITLCVVTKKKMIVYAWSDREFVEVKDLGGTGSSRGLPDVRCMAWCGDNVCIGFKKDYKMIRVKTSAMTDIFTTGGKKAVPLITPLPNRQILLNRDHISSFVGYDGQQTRKFGLSWSEIPVAMGYAFPYVIAILPKYLEVRTLFGTRTHVQTIALKSAKVMTTKDDIYVAAHHHIWRLVPVPIIQQIDQLVRDKEYEEALNICEHLAEYDEDIKTQKLQTIRKLYAYHLFCGGHFGPAMDIFIKENCDPLEVIGLYPSLLPKALALRVTHPMEMPSLSGTVLTTAFEALINYLTQVRTSIKDKGSSTHMVAVDSEFDTVTDIACIVDTCLLKAYIKTNRDEHVGALLRISDCHCHVKECERVLHNFTKYPELVDLYRGKGLHRQALELLGKLGQGPRKELSQLHGPSRTISYLQELKGPENHHLILEFSKWVLQTAPHKGLKIFTERSGEDDLPFVDVLNHIKPIAPSLVVPYLEYVIHKRGETSSDLHNDLILNYLDTCKTLMKDSSFNTSDGERIPAGSEPGILGSTRKNLLKFLEESEYYNPEKMLSRFPYDNLFEERALLLSKIEQHDQALMIYVYKLRAYGMAEQYCVKHFNPDSEESRDVYLSLLQVYLVPETGSPMFEPAFRLLNKYYDRIDAAAALSLLPPKTSILELRPFFENVLKERERKRRDYQIMKNILKSEHLQLKEKLIRARSVIIRINERRECPVCHKPIGRAAFARYPNGVAVHVSCQGKEKHICPATGTNFLAT